MNSVVFLFRVQSLRISVSDAEVLAVESNTTEVTSVLFPLRLIASTCAVSEASRVKPLSVSLYSRLMLVFSRVRPM